MCRYLWLRRRRSPEASPRLEASQTQEEKKKRKREEEEEKKRKKRKEKDKKKKRRALDERHEREREREREGEREEEREKERAPRRNCETKRSAERRTLNRTPDKYYEVFWFEEQSELKREHLFERREQTFDKRKTKHSRLWV